MYTKEEIFETALEEYDLKGMKVLLAGGGRRSARAIIDHNPTHLTVVCVPDDEAKINRIFNELGGNRQDAKVIGANLSEPRVFDDASFDFILADYLVSKIDFFAPRKQIDVLKYLYDYLKPGGDIVVIDIEPDLPPAHKVEYVNGYFDALVKEIDIVKSELDDITRFKFYRRARKLLGDIALNSGSPGFRELPGDWVERWLWGVGFKDVTPQLAARLVTVEVNDELEKRQRTYIRRIEDDKLRKYIEAILDRTEAMLREVCPFDYHQDVYIISARKP